MKTIRQDRYDQKAYKNAMFYSNELPELEQEGKRETDAWPDLQEDIWQNSYQADPEFTPESETNRLALNIMKEIQQTQEYKDLRAITVGDIIYSSMATEIIGRKIIENFSQEIRDDLDNRHNLEHDLKLAQDYLDFIQKHAPEATEDIQNLQEQIQDAHEKIAQLPEIADLDDLRRAYREGAQEAMETLQYISQAGEQAGLGGNGLSREAKQQIGESFARSPKLQKIFAEAGRITRIAQAKRSQVVPNRRQEVSGIKLGSHLEDVLPGEYALAALPELLPLFLKKFAESSLQMLEHQGKEELGSGPIICLIDGSGSMQGSKEIWSKAIMWALARMAQEDHRDMCVMQFSHDLSDARSWEFLYRSAPESVKWEELLEATELFINGGTDFMGPLNWALQQVGNCASRVGRKPQKDNEAPWEKADIILITDGEASIYEDWKKKWTEAREGFGFSTYGIGLGRDGIGRSLTPIMDQVVTLGDLRQDQAVLDGLFSTVLAK